MYRIGVDEAGRGPAIGPLVVCALGIPEEDIEAVSYTHLTLPTKA